MAAQELLNMVKKIIAAFLVIAVSKTKIDKQPF